MKVVWSSDTHLLLKLKQRPRKSVSRLLGTDSLQYLVQLDVGIHGENENKNAFVKRPNVDSEVWNVRFGGHISVEKFVLIFLFGQQKCHSLGARNCMNA